jgi:hypothetical protein
MSNGIVPVPKENPVTYVIGDRPTYMLYQVWVCNPSAPHASPLTAYIDREAAIVRARAMQGFVTETPLIADFRSTGPKHFCEYCGQEATHCYRDGAGTGHSEHVCACEKHKEGGGLI